MLDADGLNAVRRRARANARIARRAAVLTPHEGSSAACSAARRARSRRRGSRTRATRPAQAVAVVVLKGDDTLVAAPERARRASARAPLRRWRRRAPAMSSPASSARCWRPSSSRSPRRQRASACTRSPASARRTATAVTGMIASDVIERSRRCARGDARWRGRPRGRSPASTSPRSSATPRSSSVRVAGSARCSRPTLTATVPSRPRGRFSPAGRGCSLSRLPRRRPSCALPGLPRRSSCSGALTRR